MKQVDTPSPNPLKYHTMDGQSLRGGSKIQTALCHNIASRLTVVLRLSCKEIRK